MENNENNGSPQDMNEAQKPKRTFEQACKECNAVPFDKFKNEWMRQLNKALKDNGIH